MAQSREHLGGPSPEGDHRSPKRPPSDPSYVAPPIEDYALIGDCRTAALVSKGGSIDWLCWPRFDSPACFAALLGSPANGCWRIAPPEPVVTITRRYRPGTLILETLFETQTGSAVVIDFMAVGGGSVVRIVEGRSGSVPMCFDLSLRFEYGSAVPWVTRLNHGSGIRAVAGPDQVVLRSDVKLRGHAMTTVAQFTAEAGQRAGFVLTHGPSHLDPPVPPDAGKALDDAEACWTEWSGRCTYQGSYRAEVNRSLLTLKALSYHPTGGIVAAPTTSLPEEPGGPRNWDYRYCWLRDATFTLLSLMHAGYRDEAQAWGAWLRRSVAGAPSQLQTLYGIGGERLIQEWEVPWLTGYQGAKPVRIGNAASGQLQLDVYGELIDALYQEASLGLRHPAAGWELARALVTHLEAIWERPDESIWEVRGGPQQFTFSKVIGAVAAIA
jgi:GH15 family glucan-1,4-alpha-glucosidase